MHRTEMQTSIQLQPICCFITLFFLFMICFQKFIYTSEFCIYLNDSYSYELNIRREQSCDFITAILKSKKKNTEK